MSVLEVDLSFLFVVAVILIWFMIAYQFVLTLFGYINYLKSFREKKSIDNSQFDFPSCTILIPAHNEATVIGKTVEAMLNLEYPKDKLTIMVINDGSKDETAAIVQEFASHSPQVVLFTIPPGEGGKGKSRALNIGLKQVQSEIIAIYDADNTPDSQQERDLAYPVYQHRNAELPVDPSGRPLANAQHRHASGY
jgi:cellulose synthase/poly-beta-1,6-N-acetylglucosamine synthase-like glycosyltransferase